MESCVQRAGRYDNCAQLSIWANMRRRRRTPCLPSQREETHGVGSQEEQASPGTGNKAWLPFYWFWPKRPMKNDASDKNKL